MKSRVRLCVCKILLMQIFSVLVQQTSGFFTKPINYKYPCNDTIDVVMGCEPDLFSVKVNQFFIKINRNFTSNCIVKMMFDSDIIIRFLDTKYIRKVLRAGEIIEKRFVKPQQGFTFVLKGTTSGHPNLISLTINDVDFCKEPTKGLFNKCVEAENSPEVKNKSEAVRQKYAKIDFQCGRRRIYQNRVTDPISGIDLPVDTGSVVDGAANAGDWPWHVGVFAVPILVHIEQKGQPAEPYLCGGTLISRNFVLTAKYCVWIFNKDILPESLEFNFFYVALGRQDIGRGGDKQIRVRVMRIITPISNTKSSFYSIALLKLQSEVQFTIDILPACLWHRRKSDSINDSTAGVLAGWGITNNEQFSRPLLQVNLPIVSRDICIESIPTYKTFLTDKDFCAGFLNNGTAPCSTDIGGALQVFIPDSTTRSRSGAWYVKGIMTRAVLKDDGSCDENTYGIFANEEKFADWIDSNLDG